MHLPAARAEVRALAAEGMSASVIARVTGLPRSTVRTIVTSTPAAGRAPCPRCWAAGSGIAFGAGEYAELLGWYLGDGHIVRAGRTYRLRLSLDAAYPSVLEQAQLLLQRVFAGNRVGHFQVDGGATEVLSVYSGHLPCLFPQHGAGKKHERPIVLEGWQEEYLEAAPWAFLRGLMWSDGCFFINRTGRYAYLSACFDNASADIRALFCAAGERVGLACRESGSSVRIYRRASVTDLAAYVGAKR